MGSEARARLGMAALLAGTLFGFEQLFAEGDYAGPALLGMLLAVSIVILGRRFGLPTVLIVPASLGTLFWYLTLVFETGNLFYGLPSLEAARSLGQKVSFAYEIGRVDYSPVPLRPGYVAGTIAGLWITTMVAELGTFRWRRPVVAAAPAIGLFSFVTIVGGGAGTGFLVALFLTSLLAYWGLSSAHLLRGWGRWTSAKGRDAGDSRTLAGGLARKMGAATVAAALVSPVALPTLEGGILSWRTGGGGSGIGEGENGRIDPLIAIQPRLIQQSETELFRVESETARYWRLLSLGDFDGRRWHAVDKEVVTSADGAISGKSPFPSEFDRLVYSITVTGLRGESLPAAAEPVTVLMGGDQAARQDDVRYDAATSDLYLEGGLEEGIIYQVETYASNPSREALMEAEAGDAIDPAYVEVPDGLSGRVRALGDRWTEGAGSPYEKLVAIQNRLRRFEYSTRVPPASSSDYLTEFLTESRIGYCQQFATAFAVLARLQDIPTRVAVGFLPGAPSGEDDNTFIVRGTHAHAWPEAFFEGVGWVAFEPTPRSVAAPPEYSVPPAQQATAGDGPAGPIDREGLNQSLAEEDRFGGGPLRRGTEFSPEEARAIAPDDGAWKAAFSALARILAVVLLLSLFAIPTLKALRFRMRYRAASNPVEMVVAAYAHLEAEARELAWPRRPSESVPRYAHRLVSAHRLPQVQAAAFAALYETAAFGPRGVGKDEAEEAGYLSRLLRQRLWSGATAWQRILRLFSPRGLVDRA